MAEKGNHPFLQPPPDQSQGDRTPTLRMIAWEVTRSCNLNCVHCRAAAQRGPYPGELTTEESLRLIDGIVSFSKPVVILTGGSPFCERTFMT